MKYTCYWKALTAPDQTRRLPQSWASWLLLSVPHVTPALHSHSAGPVSDLPAKQGATQQGAGNQPMLPLSWTHAY